MTIQTPSFPFSRNLIFTLAAVFSSTLLHGDAPEAREDAAPEPVSREELLEGIRAYFGPGPTPDEAVDAELRIVRKEEREDHDRWVLHYRLHEDDEGRAYLLLPRPAPKPGEKLPLVLALHPTSLIGKHRVTGDYDVPPADAQEQEAREARQYALDLVRRGFVVFAPDRAAFGERRLIDNPSATVRAQMDAFRGFLEERWPGWRLTSGKNVWDLQRALDFLIEFDFIDADRIGAIGHSLGSWDSVMLAAMDDRVKATVANAGGMVSFRQELWEDPVALRDYLSRPETQGLRANVNLFLMGIAPRPFLYIWSLEDSYELGPPSVLEGMRTIRQYYIDQYKGDDENWKPPFHIYFHSDGHFFPEEARLLAYAWLEKQLRPDLRSPSNE